MFEKINNIKLLECFFEGPNKWYHLREYARDNNVSSSTAFKYLNLFYKKGILKKKKEHNLALYKANDDSEDFIDMKIFWNIRKIKNSKVLDYLEDKFNPKCIILFGSIAKGLDIKNSDIDLFVLSPIKKEVKLDKFEKLIGRPIQLFMMDKKELKDKKELANNILNGIILRGYLDIL